MAMFEDLINSVAIKFGNKQCGNQYFREGYMAMYEDLINSVAIKFGNTQCGNQYFREGYMAMYGDPGSSGPGESEQGANAALIFIKCMGIHTSIMCQSILQR